MSLRFPSVSRENYLKSILRLKDQKGYVRSVDVAERMQVSKPSVTNAVSVLRESGDVLLDEQHNIVLTEQGERAAREIEQRYEAGYRLLRRAGVPEELARRDAGAMEHGLSTESAAYLKNFLEELPDA